MIRQVIVNFERTLDEDHVNARATFTKAGSKIPGPRSATVDVSADNIEAVMQRVAEYTVRADRAAWD